ncbi:unnamed protein product [Linum tenue]|uniref:Nucleoporin Nup120/160 beta-propeller domain-containing protein n=1 Tax=Linum tenue TaxID=586396 RepID=A0AAV0L0Q2_9ROSI|nr:unnamed protein product [Linum tenue]
MGSRSTLVGVEVPITGSDSVKWHELSLPLPVSRSNAISSGSSSPPPWPQFPPLTDDCASCCVVGDPPLYFIWRIHKTHPNVLELLELSAESEFPKIGLRITFPDSLTSFAHIHQNQQDGSTLTNPYTLYVLTVSGVAYLIKLRTISAYSSTSVFPGDELFQFDLTSYSNAPITSVAASAGCLVVGRNDGSIACFRLSLLNHAVPGFVNELRDDSGINRLWGFMSRGRTVGTVLDLGIRELHGVPFVFVLHSNGVIQIWDLLSHNKIFSQGMNVQNPEGTTAVRCGSVKLTISQTEFLGHLAEKEPGM